MYNAKILIGAPCYGGLCYVPFQNSLDGTREYFRNRNVGVEIRTAYTINESLVTRARNTLVAKFMSEPDLTHLLFIDADVTWKPDAIERLLKADKDIIGGVYPKKGYNWKSLRSDKVLNAIQDKNMSDDDMISFVRANLMGYVVNYSNNPHVESGVLEVSYIGTGFMMIKRHVIEKMIQRYSYTKYNDDIGMLHGNERDYAYAFFNAEVINGRYLSEDYFFCQKWIEMGGKIYADVTIQLSHTGTHTFDGNLLKTLQITPPAAKQNVEPTPANPIVPVEPVVTPKAVEQKFEKTTQKTKKSKKKKTQNLENSLNLSPSDSCNAYRVYNRRRNQFTIPKYAITDDTVKDRLNEFMGRIGDYPENRYKGKGVVIYAGGPKYLYITYRIIKVIRNILYSNLPIEWFYHGTEELTADQVKWIESEFLDLKCIDVTKVKLDDWHDDPIRLRGYEGKPFSLMASSFEEMILVDADNVPLQKLERLFDSESYKKNGSLFWGDYWTGWFDQNLFKHLNIPMIDMTDTESGQMVVNKKRCWRALNVAWYMNNHSYYFYKYCLGDKDTYRIAWLLTNTTYSQNKINPQAIGLELPTDTGDKIFCGTTMLHYDELGNEQFAHLTLEKTTTKDSAMLRWNVKSDNTDHKWAIHNSGRYILMDKRHKYGDVSDILKKVKSYFETCKIDVPDFS